MTTTRARDAHDLQPEESAGSLASQPLAAPPAARGVALQVWARYAALLALGAGLVALYAWFVPTSQVGASAPAFGWLLMGVTALYLAACALIVRTRAAGGAWGWAELGVILLVGVALRAVVFGAPPTLSHDAFRYAWDPQLIVHGLSPYTHTPGEPGLSFLYDKNIWPNLRFRDAPTLYPPAAQGMFLLTYLAAPRSIFGVKVAIEVCDALSCLLLLVALHQRRLDLRRALLYWWAPIPIIEFALNAHVDAEAILFTLATLAVNAMRWRGARLATGALLGLATLTKLYPLLFVIALIRRRDYGLLAGLLGVIALGYAPFVRLGLGNGGFLGEYFSQRFVDQGLLLGWLTALLAPLTRAPLALVGSDLLALALGCALLALARWRLGMDAATGLLALSVAWILLSPHIFTWYIAALLPLVALTCAPRWANWLGVSSLAQGCWLFALLVPSTYILFLPGGPNGLFPWLFAIAIAVGLAPLLNAERRAAALATLRRLVAAPTRAEVDRLWRACLPLRAGAAADALLP